MFKFLKEKVKGALAKITRHVEEAQSEPELVEDKTQIKEQVYSGHKQSFISKVKEKVTTTKISERTFDELFSNLETALLESNVALEVIDKIKDDLKKDIVDRPIKRGKTTDTLTAYLKESIDGLFVSKSFDIVTEAKKKKPYIIAFFGVNGSGKTTTIAKVAHMLLQNRLSCVMVAADTFRAGAEEQLTEHAHKLTVKLIKHGYGADPAAVSFDGVKYAQAHDIAVVLIDTAGRQHSNINLMQQMEKIVRVIKPDLRLFIGESITGNDCIIQCQEFNEKVGIDAIILTKADVDEKGGTALSISYVVHKPILYLGTGQSYTDLERFDKDKIVQSIGL